MKKKNRILWLITAFLLISATLSSCAVNVRDTDMPFPTQNDTTPVSTDPPIENSPASLEELWGRMSLAMDSLQSYETNTELAITYCASGEAIRSTSTGYNIYHIPKTGDPYYYSTTTSTIVSEALNVNTTHTASEAFYDGTIYISYTNGAFARRLCSPMTSDAYEEHLAEDSTIRVDFLDCSQKSITEQEGGTYAVTLSGFSEAAVDATLESLLLQDGDFNTNVSDLQIHMALDEKYRIVQVQYQFVFDKNPKNKIEPRYSLTVNYSNYDAAASVSEKLAGEEYTPVEDVTLLTEIDRQILQWAKQDTNMFVWNYSQTLSVGGIQSSYKEEASGKYWHQDGKFRYDISVNRNGDKTRYKGQNSRQSVTDAYGYTTSVPQSEREARIFVRDFVQRNNYNPYVVTNITKLEDGVYELTCGIADQEYYAGILKDAGVLQYNTTEITVTVTFSEGQLMELRSVIVIYGLYNNTVTTLTLTTTTTYTVHY